MYGLEDGQRKTASQVARELSRSKAVIKSHIQTGLLVLSKGLRKTELVNPNLSLPTFYI